MTSLEFYRAEKGNGNRIRIRWSMFALLFLLLPASFSIGQAIEGAGDDNSVVSEEPPNVRSLIRNLGAPKWESRKSATDQLIDIGIPAVSPLVSALKESTKAEVRERGVRILAAIAVDNADGEESALEALQTFSQSSERLLATQAIVSLQSIARVFNDKAKAELIALGAQFVKPSESGVPPGEQFGVRHALRLDEQWRGKPEDLRRLPMLIEGDAIELCGKKFGNEYTAAIAKYGKARWLRLDHVSVTDEGLAELSNQDRLEFVAVWYTPITAKSLETMADWKTVQTLLLFGTKISAAATKELALKLPGAFIDHKAGGLLGVNYNPGVLFGQQREGCIVSPTVNGAAARAGIARNDIIVSFDGNPVRNFDELREAIATKAAGEKAVVEYYRHNRKMKCTVTLDEWNRDQMR